jgi:tyrosinase
MNVEFTIPGADAQGRVFLTWTPVQAEARLVNPTGTAPVRVTLLSTGKGRLLFSRKPTRLRKTLVLNLPASGAPVRFFVAGQFRFPSVRLGDTAIEARHASLGRLGRKKLTVRVRKDAQTLSAGERDRFLAAFATLNGGGAGRFRDFREMHTGVVDPEAHGNRGFLPWHRAYLLDLERELQAIDPSVALPYWRFDQAAPRVFTRDFMGVPDQFGRVDFVPGHPFGTWRTDGTLGIVRAPGFLPGNAPFGLLTEVATIALGGAAPNASYGGFAVMEGNPHGSAHGSFNGFIGFIDSAPRDPLFFLLHCNVDRLWAKWQWVHLRANAAEPNAFAPAFQNRVGHRLADTMWPWNGDTAFPRPSTAPGGPLASTPSSLAPGPTPTVGSMLDYQGAAGGVPLGFAYDDVPFELEP